MKSFLCLMLIASVLAVSNADSEDCSTRNFNRVIGATSPPSYGKAPNEACARAVFNKICDRCENNLKCYMKLGRQVGPKTAACVRPHPAMDMDDDEDECSTANFNRVIAATSKITGKVPNKACARAVFNKICDRCENSLKCYMKLGRQVGPKTAACKIPSKAQFDEDEAVGSSRSLASSKNTKATKTTSKQEKKSEEPAKTTAGQPKKFRLKTILIIVGAFVALTAMFAGVIVHVSKKKKEEESCAELKQQFQQIV